MKTIIKFIINVYFYYSSNEIENAEWRFLLTGEKIVYE